MTKYTKGILFMLASAFLYALMNVVIKLGNNIPLFQRLFFTNLITFIISVILVKKNRASIFGQKSNQKALFIRSLFGLMAMITNFYAISKLSIADSSMLNKLSPFFVTLFAYVILKEKMNKLQIPSLIVVFIGALLVIKPKFSMTMIPAASGFISAIVSGAAYTAISYIGDKEDSSTIVAHFSFVSMIGTGIPMLFNFVMPDFNMVMVLVGIGLCYGFAQITMTLAYKYAPAGEVSIYNYCNIIFAATLGFIVFKEIPDLYSLIGGIIIIITAITLFAYNKRVNKTVKN
ncbi:Uncharacterized membrane protein [Hathewaya proteolytica DSM 3090]|uniref:Uncharacterized membrane protein n=1 Tax=Hathewaya proteolytica DSM 3090 TaxID=1121331 RepID=A0A1M6SLN8_9CLOT|nr:DMT family transporter [Hathewaya proteolytica]SHK45642.1 Uncharacterized membrane protein [Hathewaya proteolytica DSM 3090]